MNLDIFYLLGLVCYYHHFKKTVTMADDKLIYDSVETAMQNSVNYRELMKKATVVIFLILFVLFWNLTGLFISNQKGMFGLLLIISTASLLIPRYAKNHLMALAKLYAFTSMIITLIIIFNHFILENL